MRQRWVADLGEGVVPVASLEDLRSMLSRTAKPDTTEFWLTSPDGSRMCMLRRQSRALLMFLGPGDADAGFTTRADGEIAGSELVTFTLANGQRDEYPASWTVEAKRAREALEYFFTTGTMPPFLNWHDDGAG
ncbi:MAG TPA: Imm1 family immunity protein [Gemmatimonadaceae bacterium]|nr:Imm1 family immunity protein [Gemmatimonadaceae bacterium]